MTEDKIQELALELAYKISNVHMNEVSDPERLAEVIAEHLRRKLKDQ